jgi:hypothetical protein
VSPHWRAWKVVQSPILADRRNGMSKRNQRTRFFLFVAIARAKAPRPSSAQFDQISLENPRPFLNVGNIPESKKLLPLGVVAFKIFCLMQLIKESI